VKLRTVSAGLLGVAALLTALWLHGPDRSALADARPAQVEAKATRSALPVTLAEAAVVERVSEQPSSAQEQPTAGPSDAIDATTISGRVINDIGESVEGATVWAELQVEDIGDEPDPQAVSDREGRFTIQGCASDGCYALDAELNGLWLKEKVFTASGAGNVELIMQRSGGVRGRVIEAYGSSVMDYIVVGRYEPPPASGEPMTPEMRNRIVRRMMKRAMQKNMSEEINRAILQQAFGEEQREEHRPDGQAWARLQPDGSFELTGLKPGKTSVIVAARDRQRGLVTITGVDTLPAVVGADPKLNPADLNPYACVYEVTVRDAEGNPIIAGQLECLATEDQHTGFAIEFKDGRARFVGNIGLLSITASAEEYQPVTVYSPAQIVTVTLRAE